ncbi:uncharacterized protein B0H64DRAFT_444839 [Chaetomium fimeti]|uniref:Putative gamma-glutamylcyclotransferase n=1 Tax=Chaetomium fimeti TaxID=1854472 RepID=A0AAE0HDG9_9PEZI|nr:hypothetical protein B0H64DRAFT_444839 [Chaetomium fimeti]
MPPRPQRPTAPTQAQTATSKSSGKVATPKKTAQATTGTSTGTKTGTSTGTSARGSGQGTKSGFFYDRLMYPEVFYKVCYGKQNPGEATRNLHTFKPASIDGYQRYSVKGADYPGITPTTNRTTSGTLVTGLTAANLKKLDNFEGSGFERKSVTVNLLKRLRGGQVTDDGKASGQVYVFKDPQGLKVDWNAEASHRDSLADLH